VSKHTTCDDVDEGGVKRLVGVPVCRCCRCDVDVGAVLLGTNKARKNRNPNTHVNSQKFGAKRTHKSCQNLCQDNAGFLCQWNKWMSKEGYGVKTKSRWMYTGFSRTRSGFSRSLQLARSAVDGQRPGKARSLVRF
jgi:hypothetical protein